MKNLFYLLLLIPCSLLAQVTEYGSFKIVETEVIYQKTFIQDSITQEKLVEYLKSAPDINNVQVVNELITADMNDLTVDYKKFQFTQVATPLIIQTGKFSGKVTIDMKENKYRVTIKSLTMMGNLGYKKIPTHERMTNYVCLNSGTILSRDWCKPNTLGLLDKAITDRFKYRESKQDSAW